VFDNTFMKRLLEIKYTLKETGYPDYTHKKIQDLCTDLCGWTGETLKEELSSRKDENNGEIR